MRNIHAEWIHILPVAHFPHSAICIPMWFLQCVGLLMIDIDITRCSWNVAFRLLIIYFYIFWCSSEWQKEGYIDFLYSNVISLWFLLCVAFGLLIMYFYVIGALVISLCLNVISVVLYRKQPVIPFHEASVQRILRVWMRSAKIYWSSTRTLVTQT